MTLIGAVMESSFSVISPSLILRLRIDGLVPSGTGSVGGVFGGFDLFGEMGFFSLMTRISGTGTGSGGGGGARARAGGGGGRGGGGGIGILLPGRMGTVVAV
jgi:hypothetical protein